MAGQILVVDDDELICDLVSETLSFEGYQVDAAYSGEQALAWLNQSPVGSGFARHHDVRHRWLRSLPSDAVQ